MQSFTFVEEGRMDRRMTMVLQFIMVITASLTVIIGQGRGHIYQRKVANGDCDLILACNFLEVPVRSEVDCALFTASLEDSGFYYNSSTNICNICKLESSATTSFTKVNIEFGYLSEGKWKSTVTYHTEAETK